MYTNVEFTNKNRNNFETNINRDSLDTAFAAIVDGNTAIAGESQGEDTTC